jgi:hypothetical protein
MKFSELRKLIILLLPVPPALLHDIRKKYIASLKSAIFALESSRMFLLSQSKLQRVTVLIKD